MPPMEGSLLHQQHLEPLLAQVESGLHAGYPPADHQGVVAFTNLSHQLSLLHLFTSASSVPSAARIATWRGILPGRLWVAQP